jgi:hypothetical protein
MALQTDSSRRPLLIGDNTSEFHVLELQLQELTKIAWTTEESFRQPHFLLNLNDFGYTPEPAQVVEALIHHAERITPGFQVPYMVPRVLVEATIPHPLATSVGLFQVDEEGWVTIKLRSDFFEDKLVAQAILAHEACHYILENSGIRKSDFLLNERYTDLCMFVCGYGQIFMAGYKRAPSQQEYRPGHRLGYLTDAEYEFAHQYVLQLRQSNELKFPSEVDKLRKCLLKLLYGDQDACRRIVQAEQRRNPHKLEIDLYRDALEHLERDRGR